MGALTSKGIHNTAKAALRNLDLMKRIKEMILGQMRRYLTYAWIVLLGME